MRHDQRRIYGMADMARAMGAAHKGRYLEHTR